MGLGFFVRHLRVKPSASSSSVQMVCLALLFLFGAVGGYLYSGYCDDHASVMLSEYLNGYCQLFGSGGESAVSLFSAIRLYYGYIILAFLFGFTVIGVLVIPALSAVYGFTAMFAIGCFARIYGRYGVWLAMSVLGVRLLFTIPCFLWIASHAWSAAASLLPGPRGKRCAPVIYDSSYFYRLFVCVVLLMIGVGMERYVTPHLFHLALQGLSVG